MDRTNVGGRAFAAATQALHKYKELEPGDEEIELVDQLLKALESGRPG